MKTIIRIFLALFLSCILVFVVQEILCEIQRQKQLPAPKISMGKVISNFDENKEKFEIVKNYMLTKDGDFYLNARNYPERVQDETVKSALKVIFTQLDCDVIYNSNAVYFNYDGNCHDSGIFYSKTSTFSRASSFDSDLGDNWYSFSRSYGDTFTIRFFHPAILLTAIVVLFVVFYLLIGLIPLLKKRKIADEI